MIQIHFFISFKLKWIKTLLNQEKANWKILPEYFFKNFGHNFLIFYMNIDNFNQISNNTYLPIFYEDIIKCWINVHKISFSEVNNFENVRKQMIWGNKFIIFNKKSLIFQNWINSNILFVNDIIDEQGEINEETILQKLIDKTNWISELNIVKNAIPKTWKKILRIDSSLKTKVKTELKINLKTTIGKWINIDLMTNKLFYSKIIQTKFSKPYIHTYWNSVVENHFEWKKIYNFIHKIKDNRIKQFKYKLIHQIIPSKQIRHRWKSPLSCLRPDRDV